MGGPSPERAGRQLAWLAQRPEQVLVLTETTPGDGCAFLADRFTSAGYAVAYPVPDKGERGVMIVSRLPMAEASPLSTAYLPYRAVSATVKTQAGPVDVLGLYVPSRDASPAKIERKQRFLDGLQATIAHGSASGRVVLGDFNILEPDHDPRYATFRPFEYGFYSWLGDNGYHDAFRRLHPGDREYSWVGRTNDGYRYDHAFVSDPLSGLVDDCTYVHEPRTVTRLSDHSGLSLRLAVAGDEPLVVFDPTVLPEPETLF
ncbi:endonuclease/exonuclease/phosphatase [Streptacidiphilus sp. P02-A3a]|nr:endonuclease/exonuclease/phosphatase [Streptacidiphilus sp. P02-A3a]